MRNAKTEADKPLEERAVYCMPDDVLSRLKIQIRKFNVPTNRLAVGIFKLLILFRFSSGSIILFQPWRMESSASYIISISLIIDLLRFAMSRDVRDLTVGGAQSLRIEGTRTDAASKKDYTSVIFLCLYLSLIFAAAIFGKIYPTLPTVDMYFGGVFFDVQVLQSYGFESTEYQNFSLSFLILLRIVTILYLLETSMTTIAKFNLPQALKTTQHMVTKSPAGHMNFNIVNMYYLCIFLVAWSVHSILTPSSISARPNSDDWAGPIPMVLYAMCEYSIIVTIQAISRMGALSIQAYYVLRQEAKPA
jgi:hypothetical protein